MIRISLCVPDRSPGSLQTTRPDKSISPGMFIRQDTSISATRTNNINSILFPLIYSIKPPYYITDGQYWATEENLHAAERWAGIQAPLWTLQPAHIHCDRRWWILQNHFAYNNLHLDPKGPDNKPRTNPRNIITAHPRTGQGDSSYFGPLNPLLGTTKTEADERKSSKTTKNTMYKTLHERDFIPAPTNKLL